MTLIYENHIKYLQDTLESEIKFSYPELYDGPFSEDSLFGNSNAMRYQCLNQRTPFFNNLVRLQAIRLACHDIDEWRISIDLKLIPQCIADFEICYCWMCPERWFPGNMKDQLYQLLCSKLHIVDCEVDAWHLVDDRFNEITKMHLPICSVDDFIAAKIFN